MTRKRVSGEEEGEILGWPLPPVWLLSHSDCYHLCGQSWARGWGWAGGVRKESQGKTNEVHWSLCIWQSGFRGALHTWKITITVNKSNEWCRRYEKERWIWKGEGAGLKATFWSLHLTTTRKSRNGLVPAWAHSHAAFLISQGRRWGHQSSILWPWSPPAKRARPAQDHSLVPKTQYEFSYSMPLFMLFLLPMPFLLLPSSPAPFPSTSLLILPYYLVNSACKDSFKYPVFLIFSPINPTLSGIPHNIFVVFANFNLLISYIYISFCSLQSPFVYMFWFNKEGIHIPFIQMRKHSREQMSQASSHQPNYWTDTQI